MEQKLKQLAELLHTIHCHWNHTDGCSWTYERDWSKISWAHSQYLEYATKIINEGADIDSTIFAMKAWAKILGYK